ncbi:rhomboid family intramembrane serine protease [Marinicella sp. W31]|uniref:rhomboid family intramembrane serine protease n=1 Tax=Marinicella sp. W31 TaxID=3023713 RepID=UPI003756DD84
MEAINQTIIIIAVTCLVSFLAWQNRELMQRLIFWSPAIKQGQIERFITHGFIHADGMHLLFNMFTLYFFGRALEGFYRQFFSGAGFIIFYLAAIVVAMIPSYLQHKNNPNYASLGASGAVSAVLFAYILFAPWDLLYIFGAIPIPAILFAVLYVIFSIKAHHQARDNINHSAHLFGGLFGVLMTIVLEPKIIPYFFNQLFNPSWLS